MTEQQISASAATWERSCDTVALVALDIDAIWWRDVASYTRPEALLRGLEKAVLPRL